MAESQAPQAPLSPAGHTFLVTGGAGFIGSHIVRHLAEAGARVRVLDSLRTGDRANLAGFDGDVALIEGDIRDQAALHRAMAGVEYVLHLAALVSVPESVERPEENLAVNIAGTQQVLIAARAAGARRVVFSSSCAVYGDQPPSHDEQLAPRCLSPYAAAKLSGEQLCRSFSHVYGLETVCLRYFNVYGPRQNPSGGYAAAIPRFIAALLGGHQPTIYGDGRQSRDFVYVGDVVQANLLACSASGAVGEVFNIGAGAETSLLQLLALLGPLTGRPVEPAHLPPRAGDITRSFGSIERASRVLGYRPRTSIADGLAETVAWYRGAR